jgi:hypothetical protein
MHFHALPFFRREASKSGRKQRMSRDINRLVFDCCARRVLAKKVVTLPVVRRPDGSRNEAAATVWTDVAQHMFHAGRTKRTFIGADAGLKRVWWQSFVAVFARGSEFQHGASFYVRRLTNQSAAASLAQSRRRIHRSVGDVEGWCEVRVLKEPDRSVPRDGYNSLNNCWSSECSGCVVRHSVEQHRLYGGGYLILQPSAILSS